MKRRITKTGALVGLFASIATVAFAYFLGGAIFEGSGSDVGGSKEVQTYSLGVSFSEVPLLPGVTKSAKISIDNTTGHPLFAHSMSATVSTSNETACPKSWFAILPQHQADQELLEGKADSASNSDPTYEIAVGEGTTKEGVSNGEWQPSGGDLLLTEKEESGINQIGCAGVKVNVHVELQARAS
jgi:hypothetical protein